MRKGFKSVGKFLAVCTLGTGLAFGLINADANASTASCTTGTYAGYCGTQVSATGGSVNVKGGIPASNVPVIAFTNDNSAGNDFFWFAYKGGTSKIAEAAPNGVNSNYCMSDPNLPDVPHLIVMRTCNGSAFQRWTFNGTGAWINAASGLALTDNGYKHQLTDTPLVAGVTPSPQSWAFAG